MRALAIPVNVGDLPLSVQTPLKTPDRTRASRAVNKQGRLWANLAAQHYRAENVLCDPLACDKVRPTKADFSIRLARLMAGRFFPQDKLDPTLRLRTAVSVENDDAPSKSGPEARADKDHPIGE
jgi:hypothetical protein